MQDFLRTCRRYFGYAFFFSMFINILQLTFSIYMLQVFDKVLTSYNLSTLFVITVAACIGLAALGLFEWVRSRLLVRVGVQFERHFSDIVLRTNLKNASTPKGSGGHNQGTLRDVQTLRTYFGSQAVFAFFDMPWMPLYFIIIFYLHPLMGWIAIGGGIISVVIGLATDRLTRSKLHSANALYNHSQGLINAALRNASMVRAMGMLGNITQRWGHMNNAVIRLQTRASHYAGLLQAISHAYRLSLQVLIYSVGAYLAILGEAGPGIMIAASIVMGRALAPIDQSMGTYKQSLEAQGAYTRLKETLESLPTMPSMDLPDPVGEVSTEGLWFSAGGNAIIKGLSFMIPPGQSVAIIGPSAAGKSTLCKLLLRIWEPTSGTVRIDRADIATWDSERLGPFIGYLPQDVEMFSGTVAENIARMGKVDAEKVVAAAQMAGVHEMVLALPKAYNTVLGEKGMALSGGQRQRVGLARALYGEPRIVVLDEPNSNLDEEGERSLIQSVLYLRQRRATLILVTHRPNILSIVDNIIYMQDGQIVLCGPRQAVLQKLAEVQQARAAQTEKTRQGQQELERRAQEGLAASQQAEADEKPTDEKPAETTSS